MKVSHKEKKPKGYAKGKQYDTTIRQGPIMIEDILKEAPSYHKSDTTVREMIIRTDPANEASPVIKRKFKPLDNPARVLDLLQGIRTVKEGIAGNNVTTGPLQYNYWRGCLSGTALTRFNMFATEVGNETVPNLNQVERRLVAFFAPREVLRSQARYMRFHMRKPKSVSTRQYVGAVATLNNTLEKLPPGFDEAQKIPESDIMDIMASKAPRGHKSLMTDHGFDPQTATTDEFVEICERAETKAAIRLGKETSSDDDSDDEERHSTKAKKKSNKKQPGRRLEFYCKEHGPNTTHDTRKCKVLYPPNKDAYKKRENAENKYSKYSDHKSKYKKKTAELHLLQKETKKEKAKWLKAYKKLKPEKADKSDSDASEGEISKRKESQYEKTQEEQEVFNIDSSSSSSSSASSSSDSE